MSGPCSPQRAPPFGRVDVLVNAAGVGRPGTIAEGTVDDWRRVTDVNLTGAFLCCREAVRAMRVQDGGVIVNVASELALVGAAEIAAYEATKGGVLQLTRAMAAGTPHARRHPCQRGVSRARSTHRCSMPSSPRRTTRNASVAPPRRRRWSAAVRRPEDRPAILFLACDDSSFVVGAALVADGGITTV